MEDLPIFKVYVLLDDDQNIIDIDNFLFIEECRRSSWTYVEEGSSYRHMHPKSTYFDKPIKQNGVFTFSFVNGQIVEKSKDILDAELSQIIHPISLEERVSATELAVMSIMDREMI